jgi:hypothetical protein
MGAPKTTADFTPEALGLPSTADYSAAVEAALLGVTTDAQARAAVGSATNRAADGYLKLVDLAANSDHDPTYDGARKSELDTANAALNDPYAAIPDDGAPLAATQAATDAWDTIMPLILEIYLAVYLLELEQKQLSAMTIVDLSPISLLKLAIAQAGADVAGIISALGDAATQATKGFVMSAWLPIGIAAAAGGLFLFGGPLKRLIDRKLA